MYDYVYKNEKFDILGFTIKENQIEEYNYDLIIGNKSEIAFLFNINNKLIGIAGDGYYSISNSRVIVDNNLLYVLELKRLYVIDIESLQLKYDIDLDIYAPLDTIYIFNEGMLICGEIDVLFIKENNILWSYNSPSWFSDYKILENRIKLTIGETYKEIILDCDGKEIN